jgi:HK97 gp10 family phage protein
MSAVEYAGLRRRIREAPERIQSALEGAVDEQVAAMQATAASLAPTHTGNLAQQIARPDAIDKKAEGTRLIVWRFGFLTKEARDNAWYWRFVELGTRGYDAGAQRPAGFDRHGRPRHRKIKRSVPPRKAQPFFGPAYILFKQAMARLPVSALLSDAARRVRYHHGA